MAADNVHYDVEEELEHLRGEVRALREEQERQKQKPPDDQPNKDDQAKREEKKPDETENKEPLKSHFLRNIIVAVVLLVPAVASVLWWLHARRFESRDDAQVDGHLDTVTARIAGTITAVYAEEKQFVKQGEVLVDLDRRDYNAAADLARSQLLLAQAQTKAEQPNVPVTEVTNKPISQAPGDEGFHHGNAQTAARWKPDSWSEPRWIRRLQRRGCRRCEGGHVRDGGIHHFHECGDGYRERDGPGIVSRMPTVCLLVRHISLSNEPVHRVPRTCRDANGPGHPDPS
jgi:hypothetical protein